MSLPTTANSVQNLQLEARSKGKRESLLHVSNNDMSFVLCVARRTWPFAASTAAPRSARAIPSMVRTLSKDAQSPVVSIAPPAKDFEKLRAKRLELYGKRVAAAKQDQHVLAFEQPLEFKKVVPAENPWSPPTTRPETQLPTQVEGHVWPTLKPSSSSSYLLKPPVVPLGSVRRIPSPDIDHPSRIREQGSIQTQHQPVQVKRTDFWRALTITRLDLSTTLTDIMQAIAAAGPFGMVTSASINNGLASKRSAEVVFHSEQAARKFVTYAKCSGLRIGAAVPVVELSPKGFLREAHHHSFSRVLRIAGNRKVKGFDEASLRQVLAHKYRDPVDTAWLNSEPSQTTWLPDGSKVIDWPFFSNLYQTRPFRAVLWQHFQGKLFVGFGIDPCGNCDNRVSQDRKDDSSSSSVFRKV